MLRIIAVLTLVVLGGGKAYGLFERLVRTAPLVVITAAPASPTATPMATAGASDANSPTPIPPSATSIPQISIPADCPPPPWSDYGVATLCFAYYPAPLATPLPNCPLNYTLQVWLTCWGYVPVDPGIYPSPPPGGWPTVTPPEQPTPNSGYPAPYP